MTTSYYAPQIFESVSVLTNSILREDFLMIWNRLDTPDPKTLSSLQVFTV